MSGNTKMMDEHGGKLCSCKSLYDPTKFMIECGFCDMWYHGRCVGITEEKALTISQYACTGCAKLGRQTKYVDIPKSSDATTLPLPCQFRKLSLKDLSAIVENDAACVCSKKDSEDFRRLLKCGMYAKSGVRRMRGTEFNVSTVKKLGFQEPIVLGNSDEIHLTVPSATLTRKEIEEAVGNDHIVKVTNIQRQTVESLTLRESLASRNELSVPINFDFDIRGTAFDTSVVAPEVVRSLDWIENAGLSGNVASSQQHPYAFGLYHAADTFKDFNVNSCGASSWIHVLRGEMWVYLVPSNMENLEKFDQWNRSAGNGSIFFADVVDKCIKCEINSNTTILIPAGWIYATFAAEEVWAVSGYFFHSLNVNRQLQVWAMEQKLEVKPKLSSSSLNSKPRAKKKYFGLWPVRNVESILWRGASGYADRLAQQPVSYSLPHWENFGLSVLVPALRSFLVNPSNGSKGAKATAELLKIVQRLETFISRPNSQSHDNGNQKRGTKDKSTGRKTTRSKDSTQASCKCHLKKCLECRNCVKRHCKCEKSTLGSPDSTASTTASGRKRNRAVSGKSAADGDSLVFIHRSVIDHTVPTVVTPSPKSSPTPELLPELDWPTGQTESLMNMWDDPIPTHLDTSDADGFLADQDLGLGMDVIGMEDPFEIDLDGNDQEDEVTSSTDGSCGSTTDSPVAGMDGESLTHHRASCHRCGNLRKKKTRCSRCPHVFCQKCAEKMTFEHGLKAFDEGCPVCKELCCCGKHRSVNCPRKYHCYKKCPSTKRSARSTIDESIRPAKIVNKHDNVQSPSEDIVVKKEDLLNKKECELGSMFPDFAVDEALEGLFPNSSASTATENPQATSNIGDFAIDFVDFTLH